ncbi:hypothetical protein PABG_12669, partial [Paracoccidioides brasiliensis Pb03]
MYNISCFKVSILANCHNLLDLITSKCFCELPHQFYRPLLDLSADQMRSFDVYCAFCSSSLNGVAIGTETKKDCELQRLFIEERIEKLEARRRSGVNCPSISVNPLKHSTSASGVGIKKDPKDDGEYGDSSYDPKIDNEEGIKLLNAVLHLGYNPGRAPGPK